MANERVRRIQMNTNVVAFNRHGKHIAALIRKPGVKKTLDSHARKLVATTLKMRRKK